jgi:hypothetical protein
VPAVQQRGPFLIGLHRKDAGAPNREPTDREPMVHVDLDHPRISMTEGEPVFLRHGGNSLPGPRHRMLQLIYHGGELARPCLPPSRRQG